MFEVKLRLICTLAWMKTNYPQLFQLNQGVDAIFFFMYCFNKCFSPANNWHLCLVSNDQNPPASFVILVSADVIALMKCNITKGSTQLVHDGSGYGCAVGYFWAMFHSLARCQLSTVQLSFYAFSWVPTRVNILVPASLQVCWAGPIIVS